MPENLSVFVSVACSFGFLGGKGRWAQACVCRHIHAWRPGLGIFLSHPLLMFFEADSLSTPCPGKLQGFTCLRLPALRLQMCTATPGFLCEGWGPELRSLKLAFFKMGEQERGGGGTQMK